MHKVKPYHSFMAIMLLPLVLLMLGCPGTTPPPEQVKEGAAAPKTLPPAKPTVKPEAESLSPMAGRKAAETQAAQIAALKGEDLPLAPTPKKEFLEPTPQEKSVLRPIYFDFDKSDIKEEYRPILDAIAAWMKDRPERILLIEGHCDERGTNEYNLALGERRALSVRRYLVGLGIHPERLHTISYGEEKPADPGHTEEAWAKNRRAEFKISVPP